MLASYPIGNSKTLFSLYNSSLKSLFLSLKVMNWACSSKAYEDKNSHVGLRYVRYALSMNGSHQTLLKSKDTSSSKLTVLNAFLFGYLLGRIFLRIISSNFLYWSLLEKIYVLRKFHYLLLLFIPCWIFGASSKPCMFRGRTKLLCRI